jgi:methionyl-tRNA formyltransferase
MSFKLVFLTGVDKSVLLSRIIDKGYFLEAVIVPVSKKYAAKYSPVVELCTLNGIRLIQASPKALYEETRNISFDVIFSCGYPFVVPGPMIEKASSAINFHPALLPRHRGRYVHWVILDGDDESGTTAHYMDGNLDTGPIIRQKKFVVSKFDTVESLLRKSADLEMELALELLEEINAGVKPISLNQDESAATEHFEKRVLADSEVDPSKSINELYDSIRVCDPELYPAFFSVDGEKVGIKLFRLSKPEEEEDLI